MGTLSFRGQLLVLQTLVMLAAVLGAGATAAWVQERVIRDSYHDRMVAVAQSVAQLPTVLDALEDADPASVIQPLAELVRESSDVTYVVVSNADGIRYSHPNTELIGQRVSTEPDAVISGEIYAGTQTGTLGESWRVKVPIFGENGTIIGQVSVGTLETQLMGEFVESLWWLLGAISAAAIVGVLLNAWIANIMRKRIYELEPAEIKEMLETREATLHGIAEGIVVAGDSGAITLVNDAALRLLGDQGERDLIGRQLTDVVNIDLGVSAQQVAFVGERILIARSRPIDVRGTPAGHALILVDRTEIDQALRELQGAQSVNESLRAQQHEFANTLHTIHGLIELDETDQALRVVERAGFGGGLGSVGDDEGVRDLEVAALLLAKRARAKELGIALELAADAALTPADADGADRVTVLGNLIDNAFDAAGAGGTVRVQLSETDAGVLMAVDDTGAGVPAADRERIFELRYSSKSGGASVARGFGLALVQRIVVRAGGTVDVGDSELGGARFTVALPGTEAPCTGP